MKRLISIILALVLMLSISVTATLNAGAADVDVIETSTPRLMISDEPFQEITPINGTVFGYLGDSDLDQMVSIMDATAIQQDCADLAPLDDDAFILADVDLDDQVTILDATELQMFLASKSTNPYITHTLYEEDLIYHTFDQIAEYFTWNGEYDKDNRYYSLKYSMADYDYDLYMAYYSRTNIIDFYGTYYDEQTDTTIKTLMSIGRGEPVFYYKCTATDTDKNLYFETEGTAELIELGEAVFDIEYSLTSDYISDFSEIEELVATQFAIGISAADEMLYDHIDGNVADIFW